MTVKTTDIEGLLILTPRVYEDERGYFFESYNEKVVPEDLQLRIWVQDNESKSTRGVLRGIHYQCGEHAQAKLVRAVTGVIYDIAVDLRPDSPTYGQWHGVELSADNKKQFYIPRGFGHGFVVLSETAVFAYKCDNFYNKESEGGIRYNCPNLKVNWGIDHAEVITSEKDTVAPVFGKHRPVFEGD